MNFDNWKLSNPTDDGSNMVSSCCGVEYEENEFIICLECNQECNIIEDYEYKAIQKENYLEDNNN